MSHGLSARRAQKDKVKQIRRAQSWGSFPGPVWGSVCGSVRGSVCGSVRGFVRGGVRTRSQTPEGPELLVLYIFKTQIFQILLRYFTYLRIWDQSLPCEHCRLWCGADSRLRDWERAPLMARTANLAQPIRKCLKLFNKLVWNYISLTGDFIVLQQIILGLGICKKTYHISYIIYVPY